MLPPRPTRRLAAAVAIAAAGPLGLAGCAATSGAQRVADAQHALDATPACCVSLAEARRNPLPREATTVQIGAGSQARVAAGGGKTFFVLYELPPYAAPYSIVLTSMAVGTPQDQSLFLPRVVLYDANYAVTREFDETTLRGRGYNLERTVFINPPDVRERYLAIYAAERLPAPTQRDYSTTTATPIVAGPLIFSMVSGQDGRLTLRPSPGGTLRVETQGLATAK